MYETKISQQPLRELVSLQRKQASGLQQKLPQPCSNQYGGCQQCARNGPICPQCSSRSQAENAATKKQKSKIQPFTTKEVSPNYQARKSAENQNNSMMEKQKQTIEEQKKFEQSRVNLKISNAELILKPLQPAQSKPPQLGQNKPQQLAQDKHSLLAQNKPPQSVQNKPPQLVQNKPPLLGQNKPELNHRVAKYRQTDLEIRFIVNKPKNNTPLQSTPPVLKPTTSQVVEIISLKNLRQTQVQIPTANTIPLKQQTSILLHNEPVEIKHLNTSSVRFRAQSQPKISETKSVYDHNNYPNYDMDFNINHISPLPLRFQKIVEERSQIQKLISVGNSDRNPYPYDFNLSDNMERSEVQQFHGYRLQNINQQTPKKQIVVLPEVLQIKTSQIEEKPTQKTQSESFEIKKYLQDADWLAHMGEVEEGKEAKYITTFMLQFVFIYFNFHFSLKSPKGECMDSSHGLDFFILRPWLLGSALADATLTIIMLSVIILYVAKAIHAQKFLKFEHLAGLVWVGKMLLWTLALTALMLQSLKGSCSADILAFGIGSIVIQTIIMVILLVRKCEQPEEQDQQSEQP